MAVGTHSDSHLEAVPTIPTAAILMVPNAELS